MFGYLKEKLTKIYTGFSSKLLSLFSKKIDDNLIQELRTILIEADAGVRVTNKIMQEVERRYKAGELAEGSQLKDLLEHILLELATCKGAQEVSRIFLLVGINGSGKTTFAAKLAHFYAKQDKKVLLVAADTFRAAAVQQLQEWAVKTKTALVAGEEHQDPASVVFKGCQEFMQGSYDILIIDTAGRLQTKSNLMQELTKIKKVIHKNLPDEAITTLLTVDAMLGQNSFQQARVFHESTELSGLILTKLDGTGKGGIVFNIISELGLPVLFISYGENLDAIAPFKPRDFVQRILSL